MKTDMTINGILIGGTIMFIGGLIDDMVNLKPKYKLAFEVAAAIVLMTVGKVSLDVIRLPMNFHRYGTGILYCNLCVDYRYHQCGEPD